MKIWPDIVLTNQLLITLWSIMHVIMTDYSPSMCLVCYCLGWWHVWWLPGGQEVTWDQSAGLMAASYSLALHSGSAPHSLSHSQSLTGAWASVCPWPGPSLSRLYLSPAHCIHNDTEKGVAWLGWPAPARGSWDRPQADRPLPAWQYFTSHYSVQAS